MAVEVFNRYEYKYLIDKETYLKVIKMIEEHMELDAFNENHKPYIISNIYYDTNDDYLIRKSLSHPDYKEKLRLRAYGIPDKKSEVYLEIKKKCRGIVNKRRTALGLSEAYEFVDSGDAPEVREYMNPQVINEITYFLKVYNLEPKVYLAYDRIAYFEKDNPDLRISFDKNIRSRRYDVKLEDGDFGERLIEKDMYLMEIKTAKAIPLWLSHLLADCKIKRSSFSKYGTEYQKMKRKVV